MLRVPIAAAVVLAALALPRAARASAFDDPYDLPDAPRPPTLPELTHPDFEATFESTVGLLTSSVPFLDTSYTHVQRVSLEAPLGRRRWFVGTSYEFAFGSGPEASGVKLVSGNLEVYGRTVWATPTGLAFGGGLGVMLPTALYETGSPAASVASSAASLRPWDLTFFTNDTVALRPFLDVRALDGPFVVQFRQGLDIGFDTTDVSHRRLDASAGAYVGYQFGHFVSPGIEAFELYRIDADVEERKRASLVVSPSVRVLTRYVQPCLSAFTNIGPAVASAGDRIWGLRLGITVVYDPTTQRIQSGMKEGGPE